MENAEACGIMGVLANPQANEVYRLLPGDGMPTGLGTIDIARELTMPPSTVSRHLSALVEAGLASKVRTGRMVAYRRSTAPLASLLQVLEEWSR